MGLWDRALSTLRSAMKREDDVQLTQAVTPPRRTQTELEARKRLVIAVGSDSLKNLEGSRPDTDYLGILKEGDLKEVRKGLLRIVSERVERDNVKEVCTRLPDTEDGRALAQGIRKALPKSCVFVDLPLKNFESWEHALAAQYGIKPETIDVHRTLGLDRIRGREDYITHIIVTDTKLDGLAYQQQYPDTRNAHTLFVDNNGGRHDPRDDNSPYFRREWEWEEALTQTLSDAQKHNLEVCNRRRAPGIERYALEEAKLPLLTVETAFGRGAYGRALYEATVQHPERETFVMKEGNRMPLGSVSWKDVVERQEQGFVRESSEKLSTSEALMVEAKRLEGVETLVERLAWLAREPREYEDDEDAMAFEDRTPQMSRETMSQEKVQTSKEEMFNQQRAVDSDIAGRLFGQFGIHTETLQAPQFQNTFTTVEGFEYDGAPVRGYDEVHFPRRGMNADPGSDGSYESYPIDLDENAFERIDDRGYAANALCDPGKPPPEYVNGMWSSHREPGVEVRRVVVVSRAVDAMAHYQLTPDPHSVYLSLGNIRGGMDWTQKEILQNELKSLPGNGGELVLAAGRRQVSDLLIQDLENRCPPTVTFKIESPDRGLSWTDKLQRQERDWIRAQGLEPMEVGEEWRGTITEAISEAGKQPGVMGFVSADWPSRSTLRVEKSEQLVANIEKVRALIAPESKNMKVYTISDEGTIHNTVTGRDEYVAVSPATLKARPELDCALERQSAMEVVGAGEKRGGEREIDVRMD